MGMRRAAFLIAALVAVLVVPSMVGSPVAAQQPLPAQVSFCDRTGSVVDPYSLVTTAADSIVDQGHISHTGPVFPAVGGDGRWGDIIPPFDYDNGRQHFPG